MVSGMMDVEIAFLPNPRREAEENDLTVRNDQFLALGLQPTTLSEGLLEEAVHIAGRYRDRADLTKIIARSVWATGTQLPRVASAYGEVRVAFVHHTENPNGYAPAEVPAICMPCILRLQSFCAADVPLSTSARRT